MKIVIDYKEGLDIIQKYYEEKGFNVDYVTLSVDSMSPIKNMEFEIKTKE